MTNHHTPAPWVIEGAEELDGVPFIVIASEDGTDKIAEVACSLNDDDDLELTSSDWENAKLITAVPKILDWLRSHPQPHTESCEAWGWADPLGDEALEKCTCGLNKALENTYD